MINALEKLASCECHQDDDGADILDSVGINLNDAYNIGYNDGQVMLARRLLKELVG